MDSHEAIVSRFADSYPIGTVLATPDEARPRRGLVGGTDICRAGTGLRPSRFSPRLRQATDLAVAQALVDEDEKCAGRRHAADLGAPTVAHVAVVTSDGSLGPLVVHGLGGSPAHQARALFGDVAPVHRDV